MATKEAAMTVALSDYTSSFYLVRRANGWHCGSTGFYQAQDPGTQFALDQALEWERYENGQLVATSHDTQTPAPKIDEYLPWSQVSDPEKWETVTITYAPDPEPLWWQQERTEASRKRDQLIALRRSIRCMLIGG